MKWLPRRGGTIEPSDSASLNGTNLCFTGSPHQMDASGDMSTSSDSDARGGDRHANSALWTIVLTRMSNHPPNRAYVERRTTEGLSKREIIRCLKRYVAREV